METKNYITYSEEFDKAFSYDGKDLGASCTVEGTIFKVWSPLSDSVAIYFYDTDDAVAARESHEMKAEARGVWEWKTKENLHGTYYDFEVRRGEETVRTADPYAVSCGCNGERSMVVDLSRTNPEGFEFDTAPEKANETIIYELHIKDFSYDPDSGIPEAYRGKYKAFTVWPEQSYPTGVEYLKELGITHVHFLPMFDYGHLDEAGSTEQFNWGYDPVNYNVPEGSYATDPHDGTVRITECKEMVQALHKHGIRVVMDVVYNHTYKPDSWLERMVPGYYNRRLEDGTLSDGSACGSDLAVGRAMVDNYIVDSVLYWAKEYHIDGFRFDLMGLLTVELMNRIREELDLIYGKGEKLLYGEPWRAEFSPMEKGTKAALKENVAYLDDQVAVFSDGTRDVIKGHVFYSEEPGFVNGGTQLEREVLGAVAGWCGAFATEESIHPKSCSQVVQYTSAHDNFTLWDKLVLTLHGEDAGMDFRKPYEDVCRANKLAAMIYFCSQGHLFMQAGEEFGRTKLGDENSFRSDPKINMLRWQQTREQKELLSYYKGLIRLRKRMPGLCDKSADAWKRIFDPDISQEGVVSFFVDNCLREESCEFSSREQEWDTLFIAFNSTKEAYTIGLPGGNWEILADEKEADCRKTLRCETENRVVVAPGSGILLGRKKESDH